MRCSRAIPGAASAEALSAVAPRERLLFDFGWKFFQGTWQRSAARSGIWHGPGRFRQVRRIRFATQKFDDSKWRSLNLPHDWAVELPFVRDEEQQSHGYKPLGRRYPETSVGWYRRTFDIPKEDSGRRITVEFDGAFRSALVFLNGYFIGRNDNGYAPFRFDVTDFLNYGGKNYLMVRMDASFGDGWFYEGAGIYRHVWLTKTDALHLGQWESYGSHCSEGQCGDAEPGDTIVQNQGTASGKLPRALADSGCGRQSRRQRRIRRRSQSLPMDRPPSRPAQRSRILRCGRRRLRTCIRRS